MEIDLLMINGNFITFHEEKNYQWIAIDDGIIIDAGYEQHYEKYCSCCREKIDLENKTVLPGFYDSHVQLMQSALKRISLDLLHAKNYREIETRICAWVKENPHEKMIRAFGLEVSELEEKMLPTRRVLDKYISDRALWMNSRDFHRSILNTKAFHQLKVPMILEGVEYDTEGNPTGIIKEQVNAMIRKKIFETYSKEEKYTAIISLVKEVIVKKGVTTINAMEGGYAFCDSDAELIYNCKDILPIDIILFYNTTDISKAITMKLERIGGSVFVDGSFTSSTAALNENYKNSKERGNLYFLQEELNEYILEAYKNNLQISVHAVGERALEQVLSAHEYAQNIYPDKKLRNRVEHAEMSSPEQKKRAQQLGLIFSMQPAYEFFYGGKNRMYHQRLGERYQETNQFKELIDCGILICGGSDSDLTPIDPLLGIHTAVNHPVEENSIGVEEAIKMFTINAAYAVNEEKRKGSIEKGKIADLVIIDQDIMNIKKQGIKEIKVLYTIKNGIIIYKAI